MFLCHYISGKGGFENPDRTKKYFGLTLSNQPYLRPPQRKTYYNLQRYSFFINLVGRQIGVRKSLKHDIGTWETQAKYIFFLTYCFTSSQARANQQVQGQFKYSIDLHLATIKQQCFWLSVYIAIIMAQIYVRKTAKLKVSKIYQLQ